MSESIVASLLVAIISGTVGYGLGLYIEHWMGPRRRPTGQYECPHGFATVRDCPACAHFAEVREREL
jgi:hypothetical protein